MTSDRPLSPGGFRILLTGPTGQVGRELARALAPLAEVICAGRGDPRHPLDLADPDRIRAVVRAVAPDLIVNAAAYTAVDRAEEEPELAHAVNGVAPGILAEEARALGTALVHLSTDYVFDGSATRAYREDDPTHPLGVYGRTKWAGEEAVRACLPAHLILRVAWVNGVHGGNFVKTMLRLGRERTSVAVVADQHGAPTFARAIARTLYTLTDRLAMEPEFAWGTYHYCGTPATTWHGFACEIFRQARAYESLRVERVEPITTDEFPSVAPRPANARLDCSRLTATFGLSPSPWPDDLADMLVALYA